MNPNTIPVQTGNDLGRPKGNITSNVRSNRIEATRLREDLKQKLQDHDMHRPRRNEWCTNVCSHTQCIFE